MDGWHPNINKTQWVTVTWGNLCCVWSCVHDISLNSMSKVVTYAGTYKCMKKNQIYQFISCSLSLQWLASCMQKSHDGRARYGSGSASFHILCDLLTHTLMCSTRKTRFKSVCLLLSGISEPHEHINSHLKALACELLNPPSQVIKTLPHGPEICYWVM